MLTYSAAERNKAPILSVLKKILSFDTTLKAIEIGSGSGQHICHFGSYFSNIEWQPTEMDSRLFDSINGHIKHSGLANVLPPIRVDVRTPTNEWPLTHREYDIVLCSNVIHITPWVCTTSLFSATNQILKTGGYLITYGPYAIDGVLTPQSNVEFDRSLRQQNEEWGIRDVRQLKQLATNNSIKYIEMYEMPANNKVLLFQKI